MDCISLGAAAGKDAIKRVKINKNINIKGVKGQKKEEYLIYWPCSLWLTSCCYY
jgi:hypothetical protein